MGFEPTRNLRPCRFSRPVAESRNELTAQQVESNGLRVLPDSLPFDVPTDPELASLVQAWTTLPNHIKAAVMALVATAQNSSRR